MSFFVNAVPKNQSTSQKYPLFFSFHCAGSVSLLHINFKSQKSGHELVCLPVHVQTHLCYKRLLYVEIQHENNTETNSV